MISTVLFSSAKRDGSPSIELITSFNGTGFKLLWVWEVVRTLRPILFCILLLAVILST